MNAVRLRLYRFWLDLSEEDKRRFIVVGGHPSLYPTPFLKSPEEGEWGELFTQRMDAETGAILNRK